MKQQKKQLRIPDLVSIYNNERDLNRHSKMLIAQGKATSKDISMSRKILQMASEEDIRELIEGRAKPTVVYDRCRGVDRSLMIPKKMKVLAEDIALKSVKVLINDHGDLSPSYAYNYHKYVEILDLFEAGFISKVSAFRCITVLANKIPNAAWKKCLDRIEVHFEIPIVEEETLNRWEDDPDRFYHNVLGGRNLSDSSEK